VRHVPELFSAGGSASLRFLNRRRWVASSLTLRGKA
jgi:hypothetical protein